jgi:hypothetical protein
MSTFATILSVAYLLVGIVIYAVTDTTKFAGRLERALLAVPYGFILKNMFLFVVILWPLWLVINAKYND